MFLMSFIARFLTETQGCSAERWLTNSVRTIEQISVKFRLIISH